MLDRILVPLDGSQLAECVLPHVMAIARAFNAQVTLLHILEHPPVSLRLPKADPLDWYLKKSAAQLYLSTVQSRLEDVLMSVQTMLLEGSAAEKIVEMAHATQTNLLILGCCGETNTDGSGVSGIVQRVLQRVRTSTLIIRATPPRMVFTDDLRYQKLLIPLDGSQRAGSALMMAAALAEAHHAEMLLVHVVSKPEMARHMPLSQEDANLMNRVTERNQAEGGKYLEQVRDQLHTPAQTRLLVSDNVSATLQNVSEHEKVDLLILSAHGYSGEARWPYGSITNRLITHGTTPLLIVQDLEWDTPQVAQSATDARQPVRLTNVI